jgi:hypothetical protein
MADDYDFTSVASVEEHAIKTAEEAGCEIVGGDDRCLLLDFDHEDGKARYDQMRWKVDEIWRIEREETWQSKSKKPGHLHMRVTLSRPLTASMRIALQAALGSDSWREMFAVRRLEMGMERPSMLFRPIDAEVTVKDFPLLPDPFSGLAEITVF